MPVGLRKTRTLSPSASRSLPTRLSPRSPVSSSRMPTRLLCLARKTGWRMPVGLSPVTTQSYTSKSSNAGSCMRGFQPTAACQAVISRRWRSVSARPSSVRISKTGFHRSNHSVTGSMTTVFQCTDLLAATPSTSTRVRFCHTFRTLSSPGKR